MRRLTAAVLATMFAWTLVVYDRNGNLTYSKGGYGSRGACDADGASRTPPGGRWLCGETKTYRPGRG